MRDTRRLDSVTVVSNAFRRSVRLGREVFRLQSVQENYVSNAFRRSVRLGPKGEARIYTMEMWGLQCLSAECPVRTEIPGRWYGLGAMESPMPFGGVSG